MNGNELKYIKELFDERHNENKDKFRTLFGKLDNIVDKIGTLPCKGHKESLNWLSWGFRVGYSAVIIYLVKFINGGAR